MTTAFRLIVTDTSPLFTLVLADSLDALLQPGLSVSIPDAVYIEATRVRGAPGAEQIVAWINAHPDLVRIVPTDIGIDQQRRLDSDIEKRRAVVDERVSLISTGDFLRELEAAGLIQSTDQILDQAAAQGRSVERQRRAGDDAATRLRLRAQLQRRSGPADPVETT